MDYYSEGMEKEMLLLDMVRREQISLTEEQKTVFGEKQEQALKLLKAVSQKLR